MNNIPTYQEYIDNKKLTPSQHKKRMEKYEALYGVKVGKDGEILTHNEQGEPEERVARPGQCEECFHGGFTSRIENGQYIRKCQKCGHEKAV